MDIGTIGSGETVSGIFTLKNIGFGIMGWSTEGPEGWKIPENQQLSSVVEDDADYLRIEIHVLPKERMATESKSKASFFPVEIKLAAGTESLICQKGKQLKLLLPVVSGQYL
jgi:hypothetical protein